MPRNLVLLPTGALGLSSEGALSIADDQGLCAPCCGGGGGGPATCCIQVAPDGALCGLRDASPCAGVTGSATLETTGRLNATLIPELGGHEITLINVQGAVLRSTLQGISCGLGACQFQTSWSFEQAEAGIVSVPNGAGGQNFSVTTRPGFGVTGALDVIRDDARVDRAGLYWGSGSALCRRGVVLEPMSGGGLEARPTSGFGGTPGLPGIQAVIASNIIRVGSVPRPRQDYAEASIAQVQAGASPSAILRAAGWNEQRSILRAYQVTGSYTAVRTGCTLALTLDVAGTFSVQETIPSPQWVYFQALDGVVSHRLHFELVVELAACAAPRGGGLLTDSAAALLARMGA